MKMLRWLGWATLYGVLTLALLMPLSGNASTHLPDDGDAVLGLWIIWWSATHWSEGYPGIFDANAFYPHPQGLLYSEPMLSQGLLSAPLFSGLDNPLLAMNLLTLITLALSALAGHLLFRELTGSTAGAVVGAVYFTFNAYSFSQLARIQLITLQWLPLGLWCLHRFFTRNKRIYLAGFAVFSALQALACFYYLAFYLVALAILLPTYLLVYPNHRNVRSIAWTGASGLSVGVVLAAVTIPYLKLYDLYGFASEPRPYDLIGYFVPRSQTHFYGWLGRPQFLVDHFIGYIAIAIALIGLWALWRGAKPAPGRTLALGYLAVAIVGLLLSAGPELRIAGVELGAGPYALLQKIPPYQNLRTPDRFSLLVTLGVALFVAYGTASLLARRSRRGAVLGAVALCALMIGEHRSPSRMKGAWLPAGDILPDVYRWLASRPERSPIAELPVRPFREMRFVTHDAYYSTFHERAVMFNKPSFYPPAMELLQSKLVSFPSRSSLTLLRALGIEQLVVHPKRWPAGLGRRVRLRTIDGRRPEATLQKTFPDRGIRLWNGYQLGGERVYKLRPMDDEGTPRACPCREIPADTLTLDSNGIGYHPYAVDRDPSTKWIHGGTQIKGDYFEIAFDRPRRPVRVELEMAYPYGEFPRNMEVNGFLGDHGFRLEQIDDVWHTVHLVRRLVNEPKGARLVYDLVPETVDRIRLFVNVAESGDRGWTIPEVYVYELDDLDKDDTSEWPSGS